MEILALDWDPTTVAKLTAHGISRRGVTELIDRDDYVVDVHPEYPDQVRVTGPTRAGRFLTIALDLTDEEAGIWRPITGWRATAAEVAYYWQEHR